MKATKTKSSNKGFYTCPPKVDWLLKMLNGLPGFDYIEVLEQLGEAEAQLNQDFVDEENRRKIKADPISKMTEEAFDKFMSGVYNDLHEEFRKFVEGLVKHVEITE